MQSTAPVQVPGHFPKATVPATQHHYASKYVHIADFENVYLQVFFLMDFPQYQFLARIINQKYIKNRKKTIIDIFKIITNTCIPK